MRTGLKIGIIGAGVIGRLLALRFAQNLDHVTLFDSNPNGVGGASLVAAGMLAPCCELESSDSIIYQLGVESLELWPKILSSLSSPVFFQKTGSIVLAHPTDFPVLERFLKRVTSQVLSYDYKEILSKDLASLEPELTKFNMGLYFPFEGQIDAQGFLNASQEALIKLGVRFHFGAQPSAQTLKHDFDWMIDCRGLGAAPDLSQIRAVRGELIWLEAPEVHFTRPVRFMHPRYPLYLVPRPQGQYMIGATQIESANTQPITVQSTLELLSAAFCVHSGFSSARILKSVVGLRPAFPDHNPAIILSQKRKTIHVNGLFRHGFLVGPRLTELVFQFTQDKEKNEDLRHYSQLFKNGETHEFNH